MDWTEKHRPRSLADVVGNGPSVAKLRQWAASWAEGIPEKRAVVLAGPPGTGKTSAALALANDMGWQAIELNASDARNADRIKRVATAGAIHQTFSADGAFHGAGDAAGRKLIVLDEADNLYERLSGENAAGGGSDLSDRGGKAQIVDTVKRTQQPMVLIVNDLYALKKGSGSALGKLAETIKFGKVHTRSIPKALAAICKAEGMRADPQVLQDLATKAEGDLRAAVRDLESLCIGRTELTVHDLQSLGARDTTGSMFDVMRHVFKGTGIQRLRRETMDLDATPEDFVLWVDENLPKEYRHPEDLARGYDRLSRADLFLGRARSTHNYRLWAYAGDLATVGVMTARQHEYRGFTPFGFPQWLSKMSRTRGVRKTHAVLAERLGAHVHASRRKVRLHHLLTFQTLFQNDPAFAAYQTWLLELEDDHVGVLLGDQASTKTIKRVREEAKAWEEEHGPARAQRAFWKDDAPAPTTGPLDQVAPPAKDKGPAQEPASGQSEEQADGQGEKPTKGPADAAREPEGRRAPEGQQTLF